jgi:ketosteroid isomerase-like protein
MRRSPWRITLLAGFLAAGLFACAKSPAAPEPDRGALQAAIQRWTKAVNARDLATLTATMTEDVELLDPATTVKGRDAAIRALRDAASGGQLVATTREITMSNGFAWHLAGLAQTEKNGDVHARGQALEIWKHVQGTWKLHRRMVTGPMSGEMSLERPSTKEPVLDGARN